MPSDIVRICIDADCPACKWPERWYETTMPPGPDGTYGCSKCTYRSKERTR